MAEGAQQKRACLHTLGCRLNQYETKLIGDKLEDAGYRIVDFNDEADLAIINTCTVTRLADSKCRQAIRGFIRRNPHAYTAVVGCYSQLGSKEISQIEGVDLILGNHDKMNVVDYIGDAEKNERPVIVRERIKRDDFTLQLAGELPFNQRANLKVQDGCDFFCSFCVIPFARGRARSRDFENMLDEARQLVARGVRELVLTGVNIGTYANQGKDVVAIVDALNAIDGLERIRISSIEPTTIPEALFPRMADVRHALMPYLHIPLQAGCDKTLQAMKRKYTLQEFADFINLADSQVPDLCIGTDILVGFPGESVDEFEETCYFFLEQPFAYCHVFSYSERDGTPAAKRDDPVPVPERNRRSARLRRLSSKKKYDYYEQHLGREMEVLFENPREDTWPGLTRNYMRVVVRHDSDLTNKLARVRLSHLASDYIEGEVLQVIS